MSRSGEMDAYAEFDALVAAVHETTESELARRERKSDPAPVTLDPAGFLLEWPDLTGLLIEELR